MVAYNIFLTRNDCILDQISLKFIPVGPIDNQSPLVHMMTWQQTGNKPLPEPVMTQCHDSYLHHQASVS